MIVMSNMITELKDNQVFVFGSNRAGNHAGGAARQAFEQFGAEMGVGEGITGQCYALPTLDRDLSQLPLIILIHHIEEFITFAKATPSAQYLLTKIGCGIAGYPEELIKQIVLFLDPPSNVILPDNWEAI